MQCFRVRKYGRQTDETGGDIKASLVCKLHQGLVSHENIDDIACSKTGSGHGLAKLGLLCLHSHACSTRVSQLLLAGDCNVAMTCSIR